MPTPSIRAGLLIFASLLAAPLPATAAGGGLEYLPDSAGLDTAATVILDVRPAQRCAEASLAGTRCLSADDFFGPHGRLAAFADIAWLLGSAGLAGDEEVVVVGDRATRRDGVAGLLHVMGQRAVKVLNEPMARIVADKSRTLAPGTARATVREKVYTAPARGGAVVFAGELAARLGGGDAPVILDGRNEDEYWGRSVRAARGGHIAGADHLAAAALRAAVARGERPGPAPKTVRGPVVVYGHDALEGFAFLTLVRAGLGLDAAVYPGGWAEWAQSGRPADSATYPMPAAQTPVPAATPSWPISVPELAIGGLVGALLIGLGFLIGRRRAA